MWSGVYPEKGKVNQTYIDEMSHIIETLESYGIYVILDMHQDMMSTSYILCSFLLGLNENFIH